MPWSLDGKLPGHLSSSAEAAFLLERKVPLDSTERSAGSGGAPPGPGEGTGAEGAYKRRRRKRSGEGRGGRESNQREAALALGCRPSGVARNVPQSVGQ